MSIKVIYIMGHARSGSTLLNTILGNCPSVFGSGELCNIVSAMEIDGSCCSCGFTSNKCPFWTSVRETWNRITGGIDGHNYLSLQSRFERMRSYARYSLHRWHGDPLFESYIAQTNALLRAIVEVSGATTIIDSSKAPIRALALAQIKDLDLRVIHLVRDVRGVVCSLMKSWDIDPKNGIRFPIVGKNSMWTMKSWLSCNIHANRVRTILSGRAILLRYEDFIKDPNSTLKHISLFSGLDLSSVAKKIERNDNLFSGHIIEGNRMRMDKHVQLKPDIRWHTELSASQKHVLPWIVAPVAWRYGYRPWK